MLLHSLASPGRVTIHTTDHPSRINSRIYMHLTHMWGVVQWLNTLRLLPRLFPLPLAHPLLFFSLSLLLLSLPFCVLYLILLNFFLTIYCFLTSEGTKARPQADNQLYSPDLFMRSVSLFCEILLAWILHFTSYN